MLSPEHLRRLNIHKIDPNKPDADTLRDLERFNSYLDSKEQNRNNQRKILTQKYNFLWNEGDFRIPHKLGQFSGYKDGTNIFTPTPDIIRQSDQTARSRRKIIQNAMKHAWNGYKTYAWGQDELLPVSKSGNDAYGGMGATLIDALDTLWLMNMKKEFWEARDWVRDHLSYDDVNEEVSLFETTIRSLGGLLSAYDLSGDEVFLEKAEDLGRRLGRAFDFPDGVPSRFVSISEKPGVKVKKIKNAALETSNIAEVGSVQIEFRVSTGINRCLLHTIQNYSSADLCDITFIIDFKP